MKSNLSAADWANIISGVLAVVAAGGVTIRWIVKHYLSELRPNHGSSLHDKVSLEVLPLLKELRENQIEIGIQVAKLEGQFEQHVREHD